MAKDKAFNWVEFFQALPHKKYAEFWGNVFTHTGLTSGHPRSMSCLTCDLPLPASAEPAVRGLYVDDDTELVDHEAFEVVEAASVLLEAAIAAVGTDGDITSMVGAALDTAVLLHDQLLTLSDDHSTLRDRICSICEVWSVTSKLKKK